MLQIYGALGLVILLLLGANAYQYDQYGKVQKELATEKATKELVTAELTALRQKREDDQQMILGLSVANERHALQAQQNNIELEKQKKKLTAVLGRPTLVERYANRATVRVFKELTCTMGGECPE